jgi:hypothetical protein
MASLLFVYSRSSIQAAKRNAQRHREADGGQIDWNKENMRRHGQLEPPVGQSTLSQMTGMAKEKVSSAEPRAMEQERAIQERKMKGKSS